MVASQPLGPGRAARRLALSLVAAGDRVRTLWWEQDLRRPITAEAGETVELRQQVYDGAGGTLPVDVRGAPRRRRATPRRCPSDMELPAGTRAVQVDLTLSADPDVVLTGCSLAVRDAAGTRYDYVASGWGAAQAVDGVRPGGLARPVAAAG